MKENISILLVEDSATDAKRIEVMLRYSQHAECVITHTHSLAECLAALYTRKFDVALVDLGLPDSTGMDVVTKISNQYLDLPVIVLTGHDDFQSGLTAIQAGAQEYIGKNEIRAESLERSIFHARERKRVARNQTRFYRDSVRALVPNASLVELQHQCKTMQSTLQSVRDQVKTRMPALAKQIDAAITAPESEERHTVTDEAKDVAQRYSEMDMIPSTSDPRLILSEVLQKWGS